MTKKAIRGAIAAGAAGVAVSLLGASGATAGDFDRFANCPLSNPAVVTCVHAEVNTGAFILGSKNVPINQTIELRGGLLADGSFVGTNNGALTLTEPELNVPGGILGIPGAEGAVLGVKSIAKLRGTPKLSIANFSTQTGVALELPIRVQLKNWALSNDCSIGSTSNPVVLKLTSGTTAPPGPNTPITGALGSFESEGGGQILKFAGFRLVDNSFAAPQAQWCDVFGTNGLVTLAVNGSVGLPAAAGKNTGDMGGNFRMTAADTVRTELGL
jgi:hypothetical protein